MNSRLQPPVRRTRRFNGAPIAALMIAAAVGLSSSPSAAAQLFFEQFNYPSGNLVPNGGWNAHSGAGSMPVQVAGGAAILRQGAGSREDVNKLFPGQTGKLYAGFKVAVTETTSLGTADYFAHFRSAGGDSGLNFRSRVFIARDSITPGRYKIGISATSSGAGANSIVYFPASYPLGERHVVVHSFESGTGTVELWVDPVDETSPKVTATVAAANKTIGSYALRQGSLQTSTEAVDELAVATTFAEAVLTADLAMGNLCVTDTTKFCSPQVHTQQPWHILFSVVNLGAKDVPSWTFDIWLQDSLGLSPPIPIKLGIPGVPLPAGQATTINWPSPYIFTSDQKGVWNVIVVVRNGAANQGDPTPANNQASVHFVVDNKGGPPSDLAVDFVCPTDSTKNCVTNVFVQQPWHVLFGVRNVGQKPVDNWTFDIALVDSAAGGTLIPIKTNVAGPPLPVGGLATINWPSPYLFATEQKGTWTVVVNVRVNDPGNPDAFPDNNSGRAGFLVRNKGILSDLAVRFVCATDSTKSCTPVVYTNQPWHILFDVMNVGDKSVNTWAFDITLVDSTTGNTIPLKSGVPGLPLAIQQNVLINWPSPHVFTSDQKGAWSVIVKARIQEPTNPDGNPTNDSVIVNIRVENKGGPRSDLAVLTVCTTDTTKQCGQRVFVNQPWHVLFTVANVGQKPVDLWTFDIVLTDSTSGAFIPIKSQVAGPPIPTGGVVTINWPSPYLFTSDQKGDWVVHVNTTVTDPTNPDSNPINNFGYWLFIVENKGPAEVTDIGVTGVCATDTIKACTPAVLTNTPWHVLFTVTNKGEKPVDIWSFDITLVKQDTTGVIVLKDQVPGPPLPLGGTVTINWPSPYLFRAVDKGVWEIIVTVAVKDSTNPDTSLSNNLAVAHVAVDNPTATLLALFQVEPASEGVLLRWQFGEPQQVATVDLERSEATTGPWLVVAAERRDEGGVVAVLDRAVETGRTYFYRLVVTTASRERLVFGPLSGAMGAAAAEFALSRVSPNPTFGPATIEFAVAREGPVRLSIVDIQGRQIAVLADGVHRPGRYQAIWSGRTERGPAPGGVYLVVYQVPGGNLVRRLALTR